MTARCDAFGLSLAGQCLFQQLAIRAPGLSLDQAIALYTADLPVQVITLVADQFLVIKF